MSRIKSLHAAMLNRYILVNPIYKRYEKFRITSFNVLSLSKQKEQSKQASNHIF